MKYSTFFALPCFSLQREYLHPGTFHWTGLLPWKILWRPCQQTYVIFWGIMGCSRYLFSRDIVIDYNEWSYTAGFTGGLSSYKSGFYTRLG